MSTQELIPSMDLAAFLNAREGIRERLEAVQRLMMEADALARQTGFGHAVGALFGDKVHYRTFPIASVLNDTDMFTHLKHVDSEGWAYLLEQSGLRSFLDSEAREEWDERLRKGTAPELTPENVGGVFGALHQDRQALMERGVLRVFKGLSWDHKTNQPVAFGKKLIIKDVLTCYLGADWRTANKLDDLTRALHWIQGTPEPDARQSLGRTTNGPGLYECEHFTLKVFKKRTGHLTFKNPTGVDGLNRILAKHYPSALPAPR